jgi:hypothetical protein
MTAAAKAGLEKSSQSQSHSDIANQMATIANSNVIDRILSVVIVLGLLIDSPTKNPRFCDIY